MCAHHGGLSSQTYSLDSAFQARPPCKAGRQGQQGLPGHVMGRSPSTFASLPRGPPRSDSIDVQDSLEDWDTGSEIWFQRGGGFSPKQKLDFSGRLANAFCRHAAVWTKAALITG